jgi:hypothetical protein
VGISVSRVAGLNPWFFLISLLALAVGDRFPALHFHKVVGHLDHSICDITVDDSIIEHLAKLGSEILQLFHAAAAEFFQGPT